MSSSSRPLRHTISISDSLSSSPEENSTLTFSGPVDSTSRPQPGAGTALRYVMVSGPMHATDTWPPGRKNVRESSKGGVVVVVDGGTAVVEVVPPGMVDTAGEVVDVVDGATAIVAGVVGSLGAP